MKNIKFHDEYSNFQIIENELFEDERGFLFELHNNINFKKIFGNEINFVQDNYVFSKKKCI